MLQVLLILVLLVLAGSAWYSILAKKTQGMPIIRYRCRPPAPWGLLDATIFLVVVFLSCQAVVSVVKRGGVDANQLTPATLFAFAVGEVMGSAAGISLIIARHGIPFNRVRCWRRYFGRDVSMGLSAFAAVALPTYLLQWLLRSTFESPKHPLVEMVEANGAWGFIAASFAAIIAAPITEELLFRMLWQGSLESIGIQIRLARARTGSCSASDSDEVPLISPRTVRPIWPMLVSSTAFALAHSGHGTDPIPLFPLGLALGYLYRQTHRIAPCIIMHASFNACSMLLLWLGLWSEAT